MVRDGLKAIMMYLPEEMKTSLQDIASAKGISLSKLIRIIISDYIDTYDETKPMPKINSDMDLNSGVMSSSDNMYDFSTNGSTERHSEMYYKNMVDQINEVNKRLIDYIRTMRVHPDVNTNIEDFHSNSYEVQKEENR